MPNSSMKAVLLQLDHVLSCLENKELLREKELEIRTRSTLSEVWMTLIEVYPCNLPIILADIG
jgi:hypothetical protein